MFKKYKILYAVLFILFSIILFGCQKEENKIEIFFDNDARTVMVRDEIDLYAYASNDGLVGYSVSDETIDKIDEDGVSATSCC